MFRFRNLYLQMQQNRNRTSRNNIFQKQIAKLLLDCAIVFVSTAVDDTFQLTIGECFPCSAQFQNRSLFTS